MTDKRTAHGLLISGALHMMLAISAVGFLTTKTKNVGEKISVIMVDSFISTQNKAQHETIKKQTQTQTIPKHTPVKQPTKQEEKQPEQQAVSIPAQKQEPQKAAAATEHTQTQKKQAEANENDEYLKLNKAKLKEVVAKYQIYPMAAQKNGCEGLCLVSFRLYPNGHIDELKIVKSSGYASLDRSSIRAIEDAAPELPRPNKIVTVTVPLEYKL